MSDERQRALDGVRVIDLTRLLPCSFATQLLADLGAEVIKVEQPGGEIGRQHDRFPTVNRHKLSVTADLGSAEGHRRLDHLLSEAHVLVESFRPGVMERFGLGYDELRERYSSLVYVSASGYPADGVTPMRPGHDLNYLASAGAIQPRVHDTPSLLATPIGDLATGLTVAMTTMAALLHARRTGQGQYVSTSMADVAIAMSAVGAGRLPAEEGAQGPARTWPDVPLGNFPCYGVYQTADERYVSFANIETKFWETFLDIVGLRSLAQLQFATGKEADAAESTIAKVIRGRTLTEWEETFAGREVCFASVLTLTEAVAGEDVARRHRVAVGVNDLLVASFPANLSATPALFGGTAPEVGAHNEQLFGPETV
jgi:crotonobetainyl-CoA:carnitine CoA-transferase CaiB-like acyl-CoA transferase